MRPPAPPLRPSGPDARDELRRELVKPVYHQRNPIGALVDFLSRLVDKSVSAASGAPPLPTLAAMLLFALLVTALALLVSRLRRTRRSPAASAVVLTDEQVTAAELRTQADTALREGRFAAALVDGFRALAVRQVERGRLPDAPGATAHEVAVTLVGTFPEKAARVDTSAGLFDAVLYGDRPATREQAAAVLQLDDDLAARR